MSKTHTKCTLCGAAFDDGFPHGIDLTWKHTACLNCVSDDPIEILKAKVAEVTAERDKFIEVDVATRQEYCQADTQARSTLEWRRLACLEDVAAAAQFHECTLARYECKLCQALKALAKSDR